MRLLNIALLAVLLFSAAAQAQTVHARFTYDDGTPVAGSVSFQQVLAPHQYAQIAAIPLDSLGGITAAANLDPAASYVAWLLDPAGNTIASMWSTPETLAIANAAMAALSSGEWDVTLGKADNAVLGFKFVPFAIPTIPKVHVQQTTVSNLSGSSVRLGFQTPSSAGDSCLLAITFGNNLTPAVSDNQGNTWIPVASIYDSLHNQKLMIFAAFGAKAGTQTATVSFSSSTNWISGAMHEYAGISAVDVSATSTPRAASALTSPAISTTAADLIYTVTTEDSVSSGDSYVAGSGFTLRANLATGFADEDLAQSAAGSTAAAFTLSPSGRDSLLAIVALK